MAEILGIITGLYTSGQALENFASQIRKWKRLSERLLDITEELFIAEMAVRNWKRKYRIENQPSEIKLGMLRVLFGREATEHITTTLGTIAGLVKIVRKDINAMIGRTLQAQPGKVTLDESEEDFDEKLVEECLRRIKRNTSWSRKFVLSVLGRADELERRIIRLDHKIGRLERLSDLALETEHPGIFEEMKRMPGRKIVPKIGEGSPEGVEKHTRLRRYAELLHEASKGSQNRLHIGLSVPQIDNRDFDFLLNLRGSTHEVIVHPVKFKSGKTSDRVKNNFEMAVPALRRQDKDGLFVLPSSNSSDAFKITLPASNHLVVLEHKESLSAIIRDHNTNLGSQILNPEDQSAVASGIARGSLRLMGSQWLNFLDCTNIRWRRDNGEWTTMLTGAAGNASITRALEECLKANRTRPRDRRDLTKHIQIFRVGLVLTELALKQPISYIDFDPTTYKMKLFINGDEEVDAGELAARVDQKSNFFLGNIVFFCLNVLQNKDAMANQEIEDAYYRGVMKDAKELESLVGIGRRGDKSPVIA